MTGAQHFMTFDRHFFEFAGDCSYLLVRDFISGTFSVIVNYDHAVQGRPVKKSLTVISGGHQLEVFPDGKLTVDGSRVEMPVKVSNTTVTRTGHMIRVADEWRGVVVLCDLPHDHCSLAISGYVHRSYYGHSFLLPSLSNTLPLFECKRSSQFISRHLSSSSALV